MKFRNKLVAVVGSTLLLASSITMGAAQEAPLPPTANANASVTIVGAGITVSLTGGQFPNTSYSLVEQTVRQNSILTARVDDLRGTAVGWTVSLEAAPFTPASATNAVAFPSTNLSLDAQKPEKADNSQTAANINGQTEIDITVGAASKPIWTANDTNGAGSFTMAMNGTLTIPAGTLVGDYTSIVTVSLDAAP